MCKSSKRLKAAIVAVFLHCTRRQVTTANIRVANLLLKCGWRAISMNTVRRYAAGGGFRDTFRLDLVNKSLLRRHAAIQTQEKIIKRSIFIDGRPLDANGY